MNLKQIIDALSCLSPRSATLALRRPSQLKRYIAHCLKTYDELAGVGLPPRAPVAPAEDLIVTLPAYHSGGGMSFDELVLLARVTKVLQPKTIFEFGTYDGLTTAVFVLNSDPHARVLTLDLPRTGAEDCPELSTDAELISSRHLLSVPHKLALSSYEQILCDSMQFDPSPYANSVDLGLIDAAHDIAHVQNDTLKMATMMSDAGLVFWHDYGGKGALRPLASYLEDLATRCPLYRIRGTSLAWGPARDLKATLGIENAGPYPKAA